MSRPIKLLLTTAGAVLVFGLSAVLGWVIVDESTLADGTLEVIEYPLVPVLGEAEETSDRILQQPAFAAVFGDDAKADIGEDHISGQVTRLVNGSQPLDATTPTTQPVDSSTTSDSEEPDPGDEATVGTPSNPVPREVFEDVPLLIPRLDLTEVVVADPLAPVRIDICGTNYTIRIDAVDEEGNEYNVFDRPTSSFAREFPFSTLLRVGPTESDPGYTVDLTTELEFGPGLDFNQNVSTNWVVHVGEFVIHDSWWGGRSSLAYSPAGGRITDPTGGPWIQPRGYPDYVCAKAPRAGDTAPPFRFELSDVEAREGDNQVILELDAALAEFNPDDDPDFVKSCEPGSEVGRFLRSAGLAQTFTLSGNPTLAELLNGVFVYQTEGAFPRLFVRATNLEWRDG